MITAAVLVIAAALLVAVVFRGWPTISISIGDATAGGDDEPVERTAAVGFALPEVPEDDWGDDEGSEIEGRRRSVGFRR